MDIELFEEFGMIAKHGNLSEAARELHVTQPALSRHLALLEGRFGVEFFDRSTSPMRLTPEGESFLHWSSVISNSYKKMLDSMSELRRGKSQVLRIAGMLETSAAYGFKSACRSLKEEDSRFAIRLVSEVGQTPFDLIRSGDLDVAVEPFSGMVDVHGLRSIILGGERSFVIMERTNRLAERCELRLDDIASASFVSLRTNKDHGNRKHLQDICRRNNIPGDVPGNLETRNAQSFTEVLFTGLGEALIMLPESMAKRLCAEEGERYVAVPFVEQGCHYDMRAFFLDDSNDPVKRLIDRVGFML